MNITVKVNEVTLATIASEVYDEDGPEPVTVGNLVAQAIVEKLRSDSDRWSGMIDNFREVRAELIREYIRPLVEEAIHRPIRKTSPYGDPTGGETTLAEVIVDEARKALNSPADNHPYNSKQTFLQKIVADEVKKALGAEIADAVKSARQQVASEIGQHVAIAVQAGLKAR